MNRGVAWITGAGGLIGHHLVRSAPSLAPEWAIVGLTRARLELTDSPAVRRAFLAERPRLVLHCAAMSRSPECEADRALARRVNVEVTERLADLAADIPFVFFSTDLVFDGRKGGYVETDLPHPLSVYGETKAAAEQIVLRNPRHTVLRTSLNGGRSPTGDRSFNEQMCAAWRAGQVLRLFTDEFRSPIAAPLTARAVWELVAQHRTGLYHVAGRERLSRWEIGRLLADRWPHLSPRIEPVSIRDYAGAPRPPDTTLDCTRAQALLSFPLLGLRECLAAHPEEAF